MKKLLVILLSMCLILTVFAPISVFANEHTIDFVVEDGTMDNDVVNLKIHITNYNQSVFGLRMRVNFGNNGEYNSYFNFKMKSNGYSIDGATQSENSELALNGSKDLVISLGNMTECTNVGEEFWISMPVYLNQSLPAGITSIPVTITDKSDTVKLATDEDLNVLYTASDCNITAGTITVSSAPAEPSYTASYANTPADSVKAGETFTSDVVVTSDSDLSSAQLTLGNPGTAAKIVSIENKLTGDNVSFESSENEDGSWLLSFYGNEASAKDGLTVATVTYEAVDEGSASLSMTAGSAGISGDTADYDITLPEASTVSVIVAPISVKEFGLSYDLVKYEAAKGSTNFTYDGNAMYSKDGIFYCVVKKGAFAERDKVAAAEGTATAYDSVAKGDINTNGAINIIDAQIAYDIAKGTYTGSDKLTSDQIVKADVNNSLAVEASDARAIQVYVHTGSFASN